MVSKNRNYIYNYILNGIILLLVLGYLYSGTLPKHADFWNLNMMAQIFGSGHYDFYDYITNTMQTHFKNPIIYPADYYVIQGTYLKIISIIFHSPISTWTLIPTAAPRFFPFFGILPNIIIFFIGGFLIYKAYPQKELVIAYLASPLAFISIQIMGQVDVYPAFFTLLALYFAKKSFETIGQKWKLLSIISLAIGAEFKTYPLLLLLPLALFLADKNILQTIKYAIIGIAVSLAPWIPYLKWFKSMVLEGESNWLFNLQLAPVNLPPYHTISIWIVGYCVLLWAVFRYIKTSFKNLVAILFLTCSWLFITVYTHPQWWIWLLPVSIFVLGEFEDKAFKWLYVALNALFIFYPMMWMDAGMIQLIRNYIPAIPVEGTQATVLVSLIVTILVIWNLELYYAIKPKEGHSN